MTEEYELFYELINPSDPVTFTAPNYEAAAGAVIVVGQGHYGAVLLDENGQKLDGKEDLEVPMFLFGYGVDEWKEKHGIESLEDFCAEHRLDIVRTLRTFCTGKPQERKLFFSALDFIDDPAKRQKFIKEWDDKQRSSLNDITNRAYEIADAIEEKARRDGILVN